MAKCSLFIFCFSQGLLPFIFGQQRTGGPWRHRIQWENNGQVYSLMSTGSQYQSPVQSRAQSRVYVSGRRDATNGNIPGPLAAERNVRQYLPFSGRPSGARQQPDRAYGAGPVGYPGARRFHPEYTNASSSINFMGMRQGVDHVALHSRGGEPDPGAQNQQLRTVPEAMLVSRQPEQLDPSISAYPPALQTESEASDPFPSFNDATADGEGMVNDDPRNPLKTHRNSVFYNMYPTRGRSAARTRRPPGTGYGTRYFQNGK